MNYDKQPLDYTQIILQLKERRLLFKDEDAAEDELKNISYFRLANYLHTFEDPYNSHIFLPNSYFEDAIRIYYFDKELRSLIFTAIQTVEIALRSKIIHHVGLKHGAFWFVDDTLSINKVAFENNLTQIRKEIKRSKEDFIQNHFAKYDTPDVPPVWKTLEVTSFGVLFKIIVQPQRHKYQKEDCSRIQSSPTPLLGELGKKYRSFTKLHCSSCSHLE